MNFTFLVVVLLTAKPFVGIVIAIYSAIYNIKIKMQNFE